MTKSNLAANIAAMVSWGNMEWRYEIHQRFGEQLVYYLLRLRPFDTQNASDKLTSLLNRHKLEGVRVFKIFGANDLLIRAWLHPQITPEFPEWLKGALPYEIGIRTFIVTDLHTIRSLPSQIYLPDGSDLLDTLYDENTVRAVQMDRDKDLLGKLVDAQIVVKRSQPGSHSIKFFIAISFAQDEKRIQIGAARKLSTHVQEQVTNISNSSVYSGTGFCDIFFEGEVAEEHFFSIGEITDWVSSNMTNFGVTTETFLAGWHKPFLETPDKISESTFRAIRGKDLFVQTIIPELYERYFSRRKEIESLITHTSKEIVISHRKLVSDYLLGYLEGNNPQMGKVLFVFFVELEEYLRENYREFIGRNDLSLQAVFDATAIPVDSRKHIDLGYLLKLYTYVVKIKNLSWRSDLDDSWNSLIDSRNRMLHGNLDYKEERDTSLQILHILLESLPRVTAVLEIVAKFTGKNYGFTYLLMSS